MKKVFKVTMRQTKKYILGILICSILSSFLTIYLTKLSASELTLWSI